MVRVVTWEDVFADRILLHIINKQLTLNKLPFLTIMTVQHFDAGRWMSLSQELINDPVYSMRGYVRGTLQPVHAVVALSAL